MATVRPRSRSAASSPVAAPAAAAAADPEALILTAAVTAPALVAAAMLSPLTPEPEAATATTTDPATAPVAGAAAVETPTTYAQPPPAVRRVLEFSLSGYMYDIAVVVHTLYQRKYVCARIKNPLWYVFQGLRWITTEMGPYQDISTDTVAYYEAMAAAESALIEETQQRLLAAPPELQRSVSNELDNRATRMSRITGIIGKLKTVSFKKKLCEECVYLFYDPDFMKGLDTNRRLVCFKNGVWDRSGSEGTRSVSEGTRNGSGSVSEGTASDNGTSLRPGRPEDAISLMINEEYRPGVEDTALVTDFYAYRERVLAKRKTGQPLLYVG